MAEVTGYTKTQVDTLLSDKADALGPDDNYVTDGEKTALANLGTAAAAAAEDFAPAGSGAYPVQQVTLTGDLAYTLPVDAPTDQVVGVVFTQDAAGGHTVTYGGAPVTVDTTAGASTLVEVWPGEAPVIIGAAPAPTGVSTDAGNLLTLGSDSLPMLDPADVPTGTGGSAPASEDDIFVEADYTGATDSSAILQAACDLGSSAGRRVVMGHGIIRLDSPITPSSGLHLTGKGPRNTRLLTPTNGAAFYRRDLVVQSDLVMENFEIDGTRHTGAFFVGMKGLYFTHFRRIYIRNLYIHDTGATGVGIDHVTGTITNCFVENCGRLGSSSSLGSSGIGIGTDQLSTTSEPLTISGCHAYNNKRYGIFIEAQSLNIQSSAGHTVIGCTAIGNKDGFGDSGSTGTRWVNCHAYNNTGAGFTLDTGTNFDGRPGRRSAILGSYSAENGVGVLLTGGTGVSQFLTSGRVADNTIMNNLGDGIRVQAAGGTGVICERMVVQDNSVYDNGGYGLNVSGDALFERLTVIGNSFDGNTSGDVRIASGVADLLLTANDVRTGGGSVLVAPTGASVTTGNFGTVTVAGADTTPPTAGTLAVSAEGPSGFTLTVTGASDAVALSDTPYRFSTNDGSTWTGWQASASYVASGLTGSTSYTCKHETRDAAGNVASGASATATTTAATDGTPPSAGTLAASNETASGFTLTVTGATDETALAAAPYAFSTNDGSTWTAYQSAATYAASGLSAGTVYTCLHRVKDAAGNVSTGSSITATTTAAPSVVYVESTTPMLAQSNNTALLVVDGFPLGTPTADRQVVLGFVWRGAAVGTVVTEVKLADVVGTIDRTDAVSDQTFVTWARFAIPTGTTGQLRISYSASVVRTGLAVWNMGGGYNYVGGASTTTNDGNLTPGTGVVFAMSIAGGSSTSVPTWNSGTTARHTAALETASYSAADVLATGTPTVHVAWSAGWDVNSISSAVAYSV